MDKIRLGSKTKVSIEVNDQGETISFDFGDPSFLNNAQTMMTEAERIEKEFTELGNFLEDYTEEEATDKMMDENMIALGEGFTRFYKELRETMDIFLGVGASQKIFGDDNYFTMFDDLFEAIEPYLDKGANLQKAEIKNAKKEALKKIPKDNKRSL